MGAKVLSLRQLMSKKYDFIEDLPEDLKKSFGQLTRNFIMIIWGESGHGKTNLLMKILRALMPSGPVLYVSLEEGTEVTMHLTAVRQLSEEHDGRIRFADDSMTLAELKIRLKKKRSEQFIVIDSVQYFDITYTSYKQLKSEFKNKTFIFISHNKGKLPDGKTADKIRFDSGIKVRVEGYIAFIKSRYGGNHPFVIWEEGAKDYWGVKFGETAKLKKGKKKPTKTKELSSTTEEAAIIEEYKEPKLLEAHEKANTDVAAV